MLDILMYFFRPSYHKAILASPLIVMEFDAVCVNGPCNCADLDVLSHEKLFLELPREIHGGTETRSFERVVQTGGCTDTVSERILVLQSASMLNYILSHNSAPCWISRTGRLDL